MKNLGAILVQRVTSGKRLAWPPPLRDLLVRGVLKGKARRNLLCPGDILMNQQNVEDPAFMARYDRVDPSYPDPLLCSYSARDGLGEPLPADARTKQPWLLCKWHNGGANVLFDDGSVHFVESEEIGLGLEDPIEPGPDSKSEFLRKFLPLGR